MTDLLLSTTDVAAVRRVLMVDDPAYEPRIHALLGALHRLIPSEWLCFGLGDRHGWLELQVSLPAHAYDEFGPQVCDGPLHTGVEHLASSPYLRDEVAWMAAIGIRDCLRVGFPLGGGRVAQLCFDRRRRRFEARDVQLLSMLQPALARQLRPPDPRSGAPDLPGLSAMERQVLELVARGATNQDVADQLGVSEATVRKHLEHVYRKLGVSNRTAASALVRTAS